MWEKVGEVINIFQSQATMYTQYISISTQQNTSGLTILCMHVDGINYTYLKV